MDGMSESFANELGLTGDVDCEQDTATNQFNLVDELNRLVSELEIEAEEAAQTSELSFGDQKKYYYMGIDSANTNVFSKIKSLLVKEMTKNGE